jgi:hypothetical protein
LQSFPRTSAASTAARYRAVHGMTGTAEIAFIGDPSITRLLIAT